MEKIIQRHEHKFKVVGCTMLIVGLLKIGEAVATNMVLKNTEERLKKLEDASAVHSDLTHYLLKRMRVMEEKV